MNDQDVIDLCLHGYDLCPGCQRDWKAWAESQNQALQEERDLLQSRLSGQTKLTGMLQERAEKAEARLAMVEQAVRDRFGPQAELILPTQETDREMEKQFPDGDSESFR